MTTAVTTSGIRRAVLNGKIEHTPGGLGPHDLKKNKTGRIVSVSKSKLAKSSYNKQGNNGLKGWIKACFMAEEKLGYRDVPIKKGTKFYNTARKIYDEM